MAGDWIKMRVWLSRDPRVIAMADELASRRDFMDWLTEPFRVTCKETAHEYVTRDVTVALCVTSLLVTWGTAREQGVRDDDDLVVKFLDTDRVSQLTGVPGFGDAMAAVGWLVEEQGNQSRLPKFFCAKASPHERHGDNGAERQRRYRERKRNERDVTRNSGDGVTRDVTRYAREEKRREEYKKPVSGFSEIEWWSKFDERDLKDDSKIEALFGAAVAAGYAKETDFELRQFAALIFNVRRARKTKSRFGLFSRIVEGQVKDKYTGSTDWRKRPIERDHDEARQALKRLEGVGGSIAVSPHAAESEAAREQSRERERQAAEMAKLYPKDGKAAS